MYNVYYNLDLSLLKGSILCVIRYYIFIPIFYVTGFAEG